MVQLSTDDVFDGLAQKPYTEFDNTNPKTVYGKSKCAGENYVKEFTHKHFLSSEATGSSEREITL